MTGAAVDQAEDAAGAAGAAVTVVAPTEGAVTVVVPRGVEATVVVPREGEATVVASTGAAATLVAPTEVVEVEEEELRCRSSRTSLGDPGRRSGPDAMATDGADPLQ